MLRYSPIFAVLAAVFGFVCTAGGEVVRLGNDPSVAAGTPDGWRAILVVDETDTYRNSGAGPQLVSVERFGVRVAAVRGRVTPFLVRVRGDNDFEVVAIGRTRVAGVDFNAVGAFDFEFSDGAVEVELAVGETLAAGFSHANPDGSGNAGAVVPFTNGEDEIWLTGGSNSTDAGSLAMGQMPVRGSQVLTDLSRRYGFRVTVETGPAGVAPPTDVILLGGDVAPGSPAGVTVGVFETVDPDVGDVHRYELLEDAGGRFRADGSALVLGAPAGAVGERRVVRVRSTDLGGNGIERDFEIVVEAAAAPTEVRLSVAAVSAAGVIGAVVGTLRAVDGNAADGHGFALVAGEGDGDNGLFLIDGDALKLSGEPDGGAGEVSLRVRATDFAGLWTETALVLPVVVPKLRIDELVASNASGLEDEDGDTPDWVEVFNETGTVVDLGGWSLSDDGDDLEKWVFPSVSVGPGGRLVVFLSGKDRADAGGELHANFQISGGGETLRLVEPDGETIAGELGGGVTHWPDVAYGRGSNGVVGYLQPTPGGENGEAFLKARSEVDVSSGRGFYDGPVVVALSAAGGGTIRYTLDGSEPSAERGLLYSAPVTISGAAAGRTRGTRVLRAVVVDGAGLLRPVATHTYVIADEVAKQSVYDARITNDARYGPRLAEALRALPVVSVVNDRGLPNSSERKTSLEFFAPGGGEPGFQVDCGIKLVGGHSVSSPKNNFRLYFRGEYGEPVLRYPLFEGHPYSAGAAGSFRRLNLRSGSHDSFFWLANPGNPGNSGGPVKGDALYLRNRWIADLQFLMGQASLHGRFVHLYVNGEYRGQYHLHEWPNSDFMASYADGGAEDYEYTNGASTAKAGSDGWPAAWSAMKAAARAGGGAMADWVDRENLADYMLLNFYAGNPWDWNPNQNWMAAGPNVGGLGGWKFFGWDSDICLQDPGANVLSKNVPDGVFALAMRDADFQVVFRDRVYRHCFHGGALTPGVVGAVMDARAAEIGVSLIAETARWQGAAARAPWDVEGEWRDELERLRTSYFPVRTATLLRQLRARGWYPVETPSVEPRGGEVVAGTALDLGAPAGGTVYYTTDGSDPRMPGGAVGGGARTGGLVVAGAVTVKARVLAGGQWSGLEEVHFTVVGTVAAAAGNVVVSEVMYNPPGPDEGEFLELLNVGEAPVAMGGVVLSGAVGFEFPDGVVLEPGGRVVVVEDLGFFATRYLDAASAYFRGAVMVAGEWGGALANGGEAIVLTGKDGAEISRFHFMDGGTWPGRADGAGSSIEFVAGGPGEGSSWRASSEYFGSPGFAGGGEDDRVVINEIEASGADRIELLNRSGAAVAVGGWFLSDDVRQPKKFRIADGTVLGEGALLVFDGGDFNRAGAEGAFGLARDGEDVVLMEADAEGNLLGFVDRVSYAAAAGAIGRWPDGSGVLVPMAVATFGSVNAGVDEGALVAYARGGEGETGIEAGETVRVRVVRSKRAEGLERSIEMSPDGRVWERWGGREAAVEALGGGREAVVFEGGAEGGRMLFRERVTVPARD